MTRQDALNQWNAYFIAALTGVSSDLELSCTRTAEWAGMIADAALVERKKREGQFNVEG